MLLVAAVVRWYRQLASDGEETYEHRLAGLRSDLDGTRSELTANRAALEAQSLRHDRELDVVHRRLSECRDESNELVVALGALRLELVAVKTELAALRAGRDPGAPL